MALACRVLPGALAIRKKLAAPYGQGAGAAQQRFKRLFSNAACPLLFTAAHSLSIVAFNSRFQCTACKAAARAENAGFFLVPICCHHASLRHHVYRLPRVAPGGICQSQRSAPRVVSSLCGPCGATFARRIMPCASKVRAAYGVWGAARLCLYTPAASMHAMRIYARSTPSCMCSTRACNACNKAASWLMASNPRPRLRACSCSARQICTWVMGSCMVVSSSATSTRS